MTYEQVGSWHIHPKMPLPVVKAFRRQTEELLAGKPNAWLAEYFTGPPALCMLEHLVAGGSTFFAPDPFVNQQFYFSQGQDVNSFDRYMQAREQIENRLICIEKLRHSESFIDKRDLEIMKAMTADIRGDRVVKKIDAIITTSRDDWDGKYEAFVFINYKTRDALVAPTRRMLDCWK
jgi:hypothetical protein